jgi:hypothetical protein
MMYLVLFFTLAIGAYSMITNSVQISYNQRDVNAARAAGESGLEFIRYQLYQLNIPHNTTPAAMFTTVYTQLGTALNGTRNMNGDVVGIDSTGTIISIPSNTANAVSIDGTGSKFFATLTQSGQQIVVKVTGIGRSSSAVERAVEMNFAVAQKASSIFSYGIANNGPITMSGNTSIAGGSDPTRGSVLSASTTTTTPVTMSGNESISGDVSIVNPNGHVSASGNATVAGYTSSNPNYTQHIHIGVTAPTFPTVDTASFATYATTTYTAGTRTLVNTVIPPNTNPNFSGNTTVQGVLYIQTPNQVTFSGNTTIQGAVVVQDNPTGSSNSITFSGNVSASSISTLPANGTFPAAERALTNAFILAPTFSVTFSGNFGTIGGSMVADQFTFSGNAGGTVNGSIIAFANKTMSLSGNSVILINGVGTTQFPSGVFFNSNYAPLADTWQEVHP